MVSRMSTWRHGSESYRYASRSDLPAIVDLLQDAEVTRWLWFTPITQAGVEAYFGPVVDAQTSDLASNRDPVAAVMAVEDLAGEFLGHGAVVPVEGSPAGYEIGFQLVRSAWGRGVGTRLSRFLCSFAIYRFDAFRIEGRCLAGNVGSASLLTNLGLRHEGTLVDFRQREDERHSELVFGARASDLEVERFRQIALDVGLIEG